MTGDGWRSLSDAGVRTIVDLRNPEEIGADTDPDLIEASGEQIAQFLCPIEDQTDAAFMARYGELLSHPVYYPGVFEFFPQLFADAITAIVSAPTAVLFNCSAGRDRTGLVAALILQLNGVVIDDILADHESGVRGYSRWQHAHPGQGRDRLLSELELDDAVEDRIHGLGEWLCTIDVESLLVDQSGVEPGIVERASRLLHP